MRNCILTVLAMFILLVMGCEQEKHVDRGSPEPEPDRGADHAAPAQVTETDQGSDSVFEGDFDPAGTGDALTDAASVALDGMADEPAVAGSDFFLWKPVSESDGNAVALFPAKYRMERIFRVYIEGGSRDGETPLLVYWPDGHNGNRVHARWAAGGGAFGEDFNVVMVLVTGRKMKWNVHDGDNRQGA